MNRNEILNKILKERERNFNLPGSEYDLTYGPNDWIAIISRYVSEYCKRNSKIPNSVDFEDSLIKAAAIIVASIEHIPAMKEKNKLL